MGSTWLLAASIIFCICTKKKRFVRLGPHSHLRQAGLRSLVLRTNSKKYIFRPNPQKGEAAIKGALKDEVMKRRKGNFFGPEMKGLFHCGNLLDYVILLFPE